MKWLLAVGISFLVASSSASAEAQQRVQVEFWHGLGQPLGGILEKVVADFNASQPRYQVNATFKGQYPETMMGAIAAFRAGNAPHIVQMFEVGTATMMAARTAIKPVSELARETGVSIDPKNYVGGVRGYYSTTDGRRVPMPFNSSTPVTWYNKDAFKKAGLDPEKPPRTWEETWAAARKIVATKAVFHGSSGMRARVVREAKFNWGVTFLPYYKGTKNAPKNSIIGGASFWVMTGPKRTAEEYKAVAEFFSYLSRPEVDAKWHMDTGYVPITLNGIALASGQGYYIKNPGADIPFRQLTLTEPTENSMGLRLGNMPEIRVIIQEEMEKAFQGQQTAKQALDNAVKRGNVVLRNFERTNRP
ncbi:MAG: extracellular solute-binding protein [candidate division NC10 bacterium]|nr:extracellular solute-binding protein [candidate division NC10 bacterium]